MKLQQYREIVDYLQNVRNDNIREALIKQFPEVNEDVLHNIYIQEVRKKVKKLYHQVNDPDNAMDLYQRYKSYTEAHEPPGILGRMAKEMDYSSAMLSKLILEHYLTYECVDKAVGKSQVNRLLRNTNLIEDRDLSLEVHMCLLEDDVYGPFADSIKHSTGHEYEFLLINELQKLNISFQDEDDLRKKGYDKTPDVKLNIPFAVDGHVVNWIESKASFGDEESHRIYLRDQLWSYWNRFGPGLVIYWFGYIEELDEHKEKGIMIMDHFPKDIIFMDPSSVSR